LNFEFLGHRLTQINTDVHRHELDNLGWFSCLGWFGWRW